MRFLQPNIDGLKWEFLFLYRTTKILKVSLIVVPWDLILRTDTTEPIETLHFQSLLKVTPVDLCQCKHGYQT